MDRRDAVDIHTRIHREICHVNLPVPNEDNAAFRIPVLFFDRPMPKKEFEKRLERKIYDPAKIKDA